MDGVASGAEVVPDDVNVVIRRAAIQCAAVIERITERRGRQAIAADVVSAYPDRRSIAGPAHRATDGDIGRKRGFGKHHSGKECKSGDSQPLRCLAEK